MADFILNSAPEGALIECGCYLGGSSAKLSVIAEMTGRTLYVCDSFAGLPAVTQVESNFRNVNGRGNGFTQGEYAARFEDVVANIERYGSIKSCEFIKGFFEESLPRLTGQRTCFVFSDADLISSTRDVIKNLWKTMVPRARFYTHDANLPELVRGITDGKWWTENVGQFPPPLFGAGYGCGFGAGSIAYFEKLD